MKRYILALDEGTTSARSILFDADFRIVSMAQQEIPQIYPQPGWVEQDPMRIYAGQYASMTECIAKSGVNPEEIAAIGITNQRETTVLWNRYTGKPIGNAIVWQCRRTAPLCEQLDAQGYTDAIAEATGLRLDAYFSATKIRWMLDHVPGAWESAEKGELLFGTVDTWLLWKLTGGAVHATDRTNASRTMLYNINTLSWDKNLLRLLDIPEGILPDVHASGDFYGYTELMGAHLPVCGIAGDQQAALFGQCCFAPGDVKNTYGTGCFLLANTGVGRVVSKNGLITTVAATCQDEPVEYALEGSVFVGGAVIQWLRDELRLISDAADSEYFAGKAKDSGGVYVVPAFSGMGAPYWDMHARGAIFGLTRGTGSRHIIRAALESIAYQTQDLIAAMQGDFGHALGTLRADGGAASNAVLMQFQSDISALPVFCPACTEATAKGVAALAGLTSGFFRDRAEIAAKSADGITYHPQMTSVNREKLLNGWHCAVRACRGFV